MTEEEKLKSIQETLKAFMDQFDCDDVYTKIVLEEFFKAITAKKDE